MKDFRKTEKGRLRDVEDRLRRTVGGLSTVINNNTGTATPLSDAIPQPLGTATAGVSTSASRGDHVHSSGLTDPTLETFAWRNQGAATATPDGESLVMVAPVDVTTNVRLYKRAVPVSTPYSFEMAFEIAFPLEVTFIIFGIAFNDTADGNIFLACGVGYTPTGFAVMQYTDLTSFNVYVGQPALRPFTDQARIWLKGTDDGTTLSFYTSMNGLDWVFVYSELRSANGVIPDEIGMFMVEDTITTYDCKARVVHWEVS